ncbi:ATP-binding protein, partial [Spirulina sp. 06S082]|uniref:ATP-binding protein n=1 Tax=Spirulina sp. 06S082 TaxID=3110248 RepID=UPI002B2175AE
MSSESPKPPLPDTIKKTTEELDKFVQWIAELIRRRSWFTLLLLVDVTLILFCTQGGIVPQFLKSAFSFELPGWYGKAFWLTVAGIFLAALIVAVVTMPSEMEEDNFKERRAIKGLRPFTRGDAEIFSRLQRQRDLEDCLHSLKSSSFRFGYLVGESGCGKTSFLQAGLLPKLEEAIASVGVYIRFSDRDPLETVRRAIGEQLSLKSLSTGEKGSFLALVKEAVAATSKPLILLFDQFEQFFVQCKYEGDRQPFIQELKEWYECPEKPPVKIIFSIRADLYYYLIEIEQALAYNPSPFEVCRLKKFSPQQATEVLGVIAETEKLEFDRAFIEKMSQQELASREDGLISPVDVQILAWMLERENMEQLRAFNEKAFQKLGGIEGLLKRYLEKVLETRTLASQRQGTIKVLLALTDLERQVRGGVMTVAELGEKLKETVQPREVAEATVWLARGDVRLISAVEGEGKRGYELAHERMIPALMQLSGKELTAADRANKLLDTRVNEWLGSKGKSRYLLDIRELWVIERQKPYLIWGAKRGQKERLLRLSKRRIYGVTGSVASVVLVVVLFSGWLFFTPQGQIQQVRSEITGNSLAKVGDTTEAQVAVAVAKDGQWETAFKLVADHVNNDSDRATFLEEFAAIVPRGTDSSQAKVQLEKAVAEAEKIDDPNSKSSTLRAIASASGQLKDEKAAQKLLQEALEAAKEIDDPNSKSDALRAIASAYGQLKDEKAAQKLLQEALEAAKEIDDPNSKSDALRAIASAYGQ